MVKSLPASPGDMGSVPVLGRSLEVMGVHSSILSGESPRTEEPDGLQSMGSKKSCIRVSN